MSKDAPAAASTEMLPVPIDLETPQFTLRAVLTGMVLGGLLSICNVYAGLTIGWGLNMSITSAIIAYAFWHAMHLIFGTRPLSILENNINQTAGTAAAAVSSAGLVAGIPALTILTGTSFSWLQLSVWTFSVCLVGITIAIGMRKQLIIIDKLAFPTGVAIAATLREIHAQGTEAIRKVAALLAAAVTATMVFILKFAGVISNLELPWAIGGFRLSSLTFSLNPGLLLYGVGVFIGLRTTTWMLLGSLLGWLILAPPLLRENYIRLSVSEPLPTLPDGVYLPPEPDGHAKYNFDKKQLEWKGQMNERERAALLEQSDDARFRECVEKLYIRSQLALTAPLPALPKGVTLRDEPIKFDERTQTLRAVRGVKSVDRITLLNMSSDPAWRAAVEKLASYFRYDTTRGIAFWRDVPRMPADFGLPPHWTGVVRYERSKNRLTVLGRLRDDVLADCISSIDRAATRANPAARDNFAAFRSALVMLYYESQTPLIDAVTDEPVELTPLVTYDPRRQTLTAHGIMSESDEKEAALAAPYDVLKVDAKSLRAATQFSAARSNYSDVVAWLLWPGVVLMVVSSLVSFAFSWKAIVRTFSARRGEPGDADDNDVPPEHLISNRLWFMGILVALLFSVILQVRLFEISWWAATLGVLLSFVLALVAGRVAGETNTTPVGAMGKVTQLLFGAIAPGSYAPNLMAATVTGGAASKCAELLFDLKAGRLVGASPRYQTFAQVCGAFAGATIGTFGYLLLLPNPKDQLFTEPFTAPAVTTWKAVAELVMVGFRAVPEGTLTAIIVAAVFGVLLPVLEKTLPKRAVAFVPSPAALGLAFVIPGDVVVSMFLGALIAAALSKVFPSWSKRFLITIAAGLVAGESLSGAGAAIFELSRL